MKIATRLGIASLLTLGLFGTALPLASAAEGDVTRKGTCDMGSVWELKLSDRDGKIEVDFEVDQDVVGDTWRVRLLHNGVLFFNELRVTENGDGDFEVRTLTDNLEGVDVIRARARNLETDELCVAVARYTA
jgi:hypothetical protein